MKQAIVLSVLLALPACILGGKVKSTERPQPAVGFPFKNCTANNYDTPWFISSLTSAEGVDTNDYTITIGQNGCVGRSPCCDMGLHKIEFQIGDECRHAVAEALLEVNFGMDGTKTVRANAAYSGFGKGALTLKFVGLPLSPATAYGSKLTFKLKKSMPTCDTLDKLITVDTYAMFDRTGQCCPTWDFKAKVMPQGTIYA